MDAIDDHAIEAYSSISLVTAWYIESNVSFCLPHLDEERTLSMNTVLDALLAVLSLCLLCVSLGLRNNQYFELSQVL